MMQGSSSAEVARLPALLWRQIPPLPQLTASPFSRGAPPRPWHTRCSS